MKSITFYAHLILKDSLKKNQVIIDATIGNGHDTLFLAQHVKHVYGFDIQTQAIKNSSERLVSNNLSNFTLFETSFLNYKKHVKNFDGVVMNLGYLPNGDQSICTKAEDTTAFLQSLLSLEKKIFILLVVYPGHELGQIESNQILEFLDAKCIKYLKVEVKNTSLIAPYIILID